MTKFFERNFETKGKELSQLRLVSIDVERHMNFAFTDREGQYKTGTTLSATSAKAVRDALIEAYPLEQKDVPVVSPSPEEPSEYRVRDRGGDRARFVIEQDRGVRQTVAIAYATNEESAKKIAQALNEAEGL